MHMSRRSTATWLALVVLCTCCALPTAVAIEPLPALDAIDTGPLLVDAEPVLPMESFTDEPGFFRRWQRSHDRRAAAGTMIETDRPTYTLAPTTVPQGWVQLETGFLTTAASNDVSRLTWTNLPELTLRRGLVAPC